VGRAKDWIAKLRAALILTLYLSDQLVSEMLPFSSGLFPVALIALCVSRVVVYPRVLARAVAFVALALATGFVGALLSRTPMSALSVATVVLLAGIYVFGAGLRGFDTLLITPNAAFMGVLVASGFLLLSVLGWDAMSMVQGRPTNRGAGIFIEPSHYALFVMPLWLIAFQKREYRIWLYLTLAFSIVKCFSATLLAFMIVAFVVTAYLQNTLIQFDLHKVGRWCAGGLVLLLVTYGLAGFIYVDDEPLQEYVGSRLYSLVNPDDAEAYNLSSLVALQGVELARLSLMQSWGLGVGLGNFGTSEQILSQSDYRNLVHTFTDGEDLNLRDGVLLANKLVGELGVLVLSMPLILVRYFRRLKCESDPDLLTYYGALAALVLCLIFVRGLPYFSAPACLCIFSLVTLLSGHARPVCHSGIPPTRSMVKVH
jgi:hypothetical protein